MSLSEDGRRVRVVLDDGRVDQVSIADVAFDPRVLQRNEQEGSRKEKSHSSGSSASSPVPDFVLFIDLMENLRLLVSKVKARLKNCPATNLGSLIPQVVVVGSQSAGKSTLLNRMMPPSLPSDFCLPTGGGICTRMPIIISFTKHPVPLLRYSLLAHNFSSPPYEKENFSSLDWTDMTLAVAEHNRKYSGFNPANKIFLTIGTPDGLPFTYVDTPGTVVGMNGPQIEAIVNGEIGKADVIILAQVAQSDIESAGPLPAVLARKEAHPGVVVFGVVTKADAWVDAVDIDARVDDLQGRGFRPVFTSAGTKDQPIQPVDEREAILSCFPSLSSRDIILGAAELQLHLVEAYGGLARSRILQVRSAMQKFRDHLHNDLDVIGKEPKTSSDIHKQLLSLFREVIKDLKSSPLRSDASRDLLVYVNDNSVLTKALRAENVSGYIAKARAELIPGAEGVYDSLVLVWKDVASLMNSEGKLQHKIKNVISKIKDATLAAARSNPTVSKRVAAVIDNLISNTLERVASAQYEEIWKQVNSHLTAKPSTCEAYEHAAFSSSTVPVSLVELMMDFLSKWEDKKTSYTSEDIPKFAAASTFHFATAVPEDEVLKDKLVNVCHWYWKFFADRISAVLKPPLQELLDKFLAEIQDALIDLNDSSIPVEDEEIRSLRELIRTTLTDLAEIEARLEC